MSVHRPSNNICELDSKNPLNARRASPHRITGPFGLTFEASFTMQRVVVEMLEGFLNQAARTG